MKPFLVTHNVTMSTNIAVVVVVVVVVVVDDDVLLV